MAAKEEEEEKVVEVVKPASGLKRKILIALGLLLIVVISAGIPTTLFLMRGKSEKTAEELDKNAAATEVEDHQAKLSALEEELEEGEEVLGAIAPFDTFVVNLEGARYARIQVQVEFTTMDVPRRFFSKVVVMRDAIISLLSAKKSEDLNGAKGKETLRSEIRERLNGILKREDIKRVYFTQFVVQ